MFLRNYRLQSIPRKRKLKLLRTLLFAFIIISAIIFSSLTEAESAPNYLMDSLNTAGTVYFDFGKSELKEESFGLLNKLAEELKSSPEAKIEITGHTDNVGSEGFNNNLSINRAEAVSAYLIGLGVKEQQIIVKGEGFSKPIIDNNTEKHRSLNRRVEFRWIMQITTRPKDEIDESFVNTGSWKTSRTEITGELSIRDTSGEPITDIKENDVSAVLKWTQNEAEDSADGTVKLFPIDDKKKIAFTFTMDYSGSMFDSSNEINAKKTEKIKSMEKAVITFIENMDNRFFGKIIKFGDVVEIVLGFSRNKSMMKDAVINYSRNRMSTALYKSIWFALKDTTYNSNPTIMKTVIAFTDGEENSSGKITKDSIYRYSDMRGTRVFSVGLIDEPKHSTPLGMNSKGEADLVEIAKRTGGFYYWAKDPASLPYIYKQIYEQIMKSFNVSILWNGEKLPPKGTTVTAIVRVKVKGMIRTLYKNYVME